MSLEVPHILIAYDNLEIPSGIVSIEGFRTRSVRQAIIIQLSVQGLHPIGGDPGMESITAGSFKGREAMLELLKAVCVNVYITIRESLNGEALQTPSDLLRSMVK